jgi:hypothetical protein
MSRHVTVVLALLLVLGSSGLSAGASARGGGAAAGSRGNNFGGGFAGTPGGGYRAGDLRGEFHSDRDAWGHWGAYYGPMIPMT